MNIKKKDLVKAPWQHKVRHESTVSFKVGEVVFLKSNPETPLTVRRIASKPLRLSEGTYDAVYVTGGEDREQRGFPPQCLLQYDYAGLLVSSHGKFEISLN